MDTSWRDSNFYNNFDSSTASSKITFAILCNKQIEQPKSLYVIRNTTVINNSLLLVICCTKLWCFLNLPVFHIHKFTIKLYVPKNTLWKYKSKIHNGLNQNRYKLNKVNLKNYFSFFFCFFFLVFWLKKNDTKESFFLFYSQVNYVSNLLTSFQFV